MSSALTLDYPSSANTENPDINRKLYYYNCDGDDNRGRRAQLVRE
jgi:hypothetical protein